MPVHSRLGYFVPIACMIRTMGLLRLMTWASGADFIDLAANVENGRNDAERREQASRIPVLAKDLPKAVLQRDFPVLLPQLMSVTNLNRVTQTCAPLSASSRKGVASMVKGRDLSLT